MPLKLGRKPYQEDMRDLTLAEVMPQGVSLPNVPKPGGGFGGDFGYTGWLMLGNGPDDTVFPGFGGAGDCAWAGPGHEEMEAAHNARRPIPQFSGKTIVDQYANYVASMNNGQAYNPQTGANDLGSDVRDVLKLRQNPGLVDDHGNVFKIGTFIKLNPQDPSELWDALWLFECVAWGMNFPASAMTQFEAGEEWAWDGSQIEGGHYVPIMGHPDGETWACITWGRRQPMTQDFLLKAGEEAWAYLDIERYNAVTGKTYSGWQDADLEHYITALAAEINQS